MQWVFLLLLPHIVLPWVGRNGYFEPRRSLRWIADQLFERTDGFLGHERAYWRAYGFIVPFPLNVHNVIDRPPDVDLAGDLAVPGDGGRSRSSSAGGARAAPADGSAPPGRMAETMGDAQREKMPHGPQWNRLNMIGQGAPGRRPRAVRPAVPLVDAGPAIVGADGVPGGVHGAAVLQLHLAGPGLPRGHRRHRLDVLVQRPGMVPFRVPAAARWSHIHARSSQSRILPDKAKCISCGVCTSVCHAGVDVMNFANKDQPVRDPQCVRCSACVGECPTAALSFGYVRKSGEVAFDRLRAIPAHFVSTRP